MVVNLYPFRATVTASPAPAFEVGVENIDIGGPTMIRCAAAALGGRVTQLLPTSCAFRWQRHTMLLRCAALAMIATCAALRRAAAKNHAHVTVVVDPSDYQPLLDKLASGEDMEGFRKQLAWKAFQVRSPGLWLAWLLESVPGGLAAATL